MLPFVAPLLLVLVQLEGGAAVNRTRHLGRETGPAAIANATSRLGNPKEGVTLRPLTEWKGGLNMGVFYRIYRSSLPIVRTHTYILYEKTLQQKPNYTVHEHRRTLEYFCSECFCFATFVECSLDILLFFFTCGEADRS